MNIYFDNAATTALHREVVAKMTEVLTDNYGNPSATYALGRKTRTLIETARKQIAQQLGAQSSEIIFTSGGSEADNLILRGCVRDLGVRVIITSLIEHHAVLHTVEALAKEYGVQIEYVHLTTEGDVCLQHLETLLQQYADQKVLVSLMHVNNEIGNILPLATVAAFCKKYGAYFHSDTVQSVAHLPIDLREVPVDFITASAHKFHGPKGVGFAFIRKGIVLHPLIYGGEQEKGLRAGTEAVHNIVGMQEALKLAYRDRASHTEKLHQLKQYFIAALKEHFPEVVFNGNSQDEEKSSHTILNVGFPNWENKKDTLLFESDLKGVACSKGSACQSGSVGESHVLQAFLPAERLRYPSLRFSFSIQNTTEEVDNLIKILGEIAKK